MNVNSHVFSAVLCISFVSLPASLWAQVTADDFLPPVTGGPSDVKQPEKVAITNDKVTAASAQDAINVAVQENVKELKDNIEEVGARMVSFPSGLGFVATGAAFYREMPNPTATRIAKRQAYVIAFAKAKKNLAEILGGLSNDSKEAIREQFVNINLPEEEMTNISTQSDEALRQSVEMLLRGFVIYQVKDDVANGTVYVSIVTTPKTRGKYARPAPNMVVAETLRDGLNQVIAEVRSGLVPPVGGRIITMRATGETAFVGFGSSVVRTSENRTVQQRHNLEAQKIAAMRSKDALCGLIVGDKAMWEGNVTESMQDSVQEFESLVRDDPLAAKDPTAVRKLEQARETFVARMASNDAYTSARKGLLPPGVNTKTWFDEDNAWSFGMSVYAPSLTNAAASAAREMQESQIVQPVDDRAFPATGNVPGATRPDVKKPGSKVKPGPTGKIDPDGE